MISGDFVLEKEKGKLTNAHCELPGGWCDEVRRGTF